jgi:predicted RNA-binding Zn ribbon-like protein
MTGYVERPLVGEPLGLDLLNTTWRGRSGPADLLVDLDGTRQWLTEHDLAGPATDATRRALVTAREAIRAHAAEGTGVALNEVLAWGRQRPVLGQDGPDTVVEVDQPAHLAGWLAAVDYLRLLTESADRVRHCAHPDCVLYFHDTSPKRSRRWCSMAGCGNRAKAARHYARSKVDS